MLYIVHYTMLDCTLHQSTINTQHRTPQSTGSLHCTLHQSKKKVYFTVHILCTKVPYSRLNTLYNLKHLISTFHASFLYLSPSGILILYYISEFEINKTILIDIFGFRLMYSISFKKQTF